MIKTLEELIKILDDLSDERELLIKRLEQERKDIEGLQEQIYELINWYNEGGK